MNAALSFQFVQEHGAGNPDMRTARNVIEQVIPKAREWAASADEIALVDAAEAQARKTLEAA